MNNRPILRPTPYLFDGKHIIRMVQIEDKPHVAACDIADPLGFTYGNLHHHLSHNVNLDERPVVKLAGCSGMAHTVLSSEGVRELVANSKIDTAAFIKWLNINVFNIKDELAVNQAVATAVPM